MSQLPTDLYVARQTITTWRDHADSPDVAKAFDEALAVLPDPSLFFDVDGKTEGLVLGMRPSPFTKPTIVSRAGSALAIVLFTVALAFAVFAGTNLLFEGGQNVVGDIVVALLCAGAGLAVRKATR